MRVQPTTLRILPETRAAIEEIVRRTGRDFSSVANEMLDEAVRMRRIPGIVFADGPWGRRARVAGTGIDVFEVIRTFREVGEDWERLKAAYHWLSELQVRAALAYAKAYPEEIERRLSMEGDWTPGRVKVEYPFTDPERA